MKLWPALLLLSVAAGCSNTLADSARQSKAGEPLVDGQLEGYRSELLELAFEAVSAMPLRPHLKNRCREQERVVEACLELDQRKRALAYIERIENWRRGAGYADLAYHLAQRGDGKAAREYVVRARAVLETDEVGAEQGWRRDNIRSKIARAHLLLGEDEQAAAFEEGLSDSELGRVLAAKARLTEADSLDASLAALEQLVLAGSFDQVRGAMDSYAQLFDRFYDDKERRASIELQLLAATKKAPRQVGVELGMQLASFALEHADRVKALELIESAGLSAEEAAWTAEAYVPITGRLARLRCQAGDADRARAEAQAALVRFEQERETILGVLRPEVLIPVAEAFSALGDTASALAVYQQALAETVANPNARPRSINLAAICLSMAKNACEPSEELRGQFARAREQLVDPW